MNTGHLQTAYANARECSNKALNQTLLTSNDKESREKNNSQYDSWYKLQKQIDSMKQYMSNINKQLENACCGTRSEILKRNKIVQEDLYQTDNSLAQTNAQMQNLPQKSIQELTSIYTQTTKILLPNNNYDHMPNPNSTTPIWFKHLQESINEYNQKINLS